MRYELTGLVVTDSKMFNRTGTVGRWAETVNVRFTANAKAEAPHGADTGRINKTGSYPVGSLRDSITGDVDRIGPRQLQTTISVGVPYALAVLKGTGPWIFAKSARDEGGRFVSLEEGVGMYIPANPGWGKSLMRQRVRGQSANNFLERAFAATARRHSSLRGYSMVGSF